MHVGKWDLFSNKWTFCFGTWSFRFGRNSFKTLSPKPLTQQFWLWNSIFDAQCSGTHFLCLCLCIRPFCETCPFLVSPLDWSIILMIAMLVSKSTTSREKPSEPPNSLHGKISTLLKIISYWNKKRILRKLSSAEHISKQTFVLVMRGKSEKIIKNSLKLKQSNNW